MADFGLGVDDPQGRAVLEEYCARLEADADRAGPPDTGESWQVLRRRMVDEETIAYGTEGTHATRRVRRAWSTWYAFVAGAATLLVVLGAERLVSARVGSPKASSAMTYATSAGQRATITLSDGSTVTLNVASTLTVPADYARGNRTLRLSGEALFTVRHQDGAPFIVAAGPAAARVLGTSFVVRHYPADSSAVIAVRDGKVAVRSAVLTAGQEASVRSGRSPAVLRASPSLFSFATGVLTLEDMPLSRAIPELNRWFDADIRLANAALGEQRIEGKFAAGSLADLSAMLELTFDIRAERDGRVLTLYPKR